MFDPAKFDCSFQNVFTKRNLSYETISSLFPVPAKRACPEKPYHDGAALFVLRKF